MSDLERMVDGLSRAAHAPAASAAIDALAAHRRKDSVIVAPAHPNFRLWLSSEPTPQFPVSLLQASIKMTTEPPKGIRANMLRLYDLITADQFAQCTKPAKYKKLLFSLCFFHSILVERKKFQTLGWNVPYDFNDSDFMVCENLLSLYLDEYDETPWDALKYLIAQANYGGRVTDSLDRRLLSVYVSQYFCDDAINVPNYKLSALESYKIPEDGTLDSYKKYIATLPATGADPPEAFGQNANADLACQLQESTKLLDAMLRLQPPVVTNGAPSRESTVLELISQLLPQIPAELDLKAVARKHRDDHSPYKTVLLQEVARYNAVLQIVRQSLLDLQRGLQGLVVISPELEQVFDALFAAKVPQLWQSQYASVKPLGPWVRDLGERVEQFKQWAAHGPPKVFWLGGFTAPTGFLTAVLQSAARKSGIPIDNLAWEFSTVNQDEASLSSAPKEGAYIKGLFLEGARWEEKGDCLAEPLPMDLYSRMPILHFKPVEFKKRAGKALYACPLYYYAVRTGSREKPSFIMTVDLKSGAADSDFWIKRGTALLCSMDN